MKKRLLSVVLAFTLCFGMMPVTVLAEEMGNAETVAPAPDDQVVVRAYPRCIGPMKRLRAEIL